MQDSTVLRTAGGRGERALWHRSFGLRRGCRGWREPSQSLPRQGSPGKRWSFGPLTEPLEKSSVICSGCVGRRNPRGMAIRGYMGEEGLGAASHLPGRDCRGGSVTGHSLPRRQGVGRCSRQICWLGARRPGTALGLEEPH